MLPQLVAIGIVCVVAFIALDIGIWFYVDDMSAKVFGCVSLALLLILSVNFGASLCLYLNEQKETVPVHKPTDPVTWGEFEEALRAAGISVQGEYE